ncbi:MAG: hypothetical protein LBF78_07105 [Treponema sp.]|jgi:hypothetical protein|nr:hypothetical protein [Treponema sp.]
MGEMELSLLNGQKEGHQAIVAAITDLDRLGYLVSSIKSKDGTLEITCYPPRKEEGNSRG